MIDGIGQVPPPLDGIRSAWFRPFLKRQTWRSVFMSALAATGICCTYATHAKRGRLGSQRHRPRFPWATLPCDTCNANWRGAGPRCPFEVTTVH